MAKTSKSVARLLGLTGLSAVCLVAAPAGAAVVLGPPQMVTTASVEDVITGQTTVEHTSDTGSATLTSVAIGGEGGQASSTVAVSPGVLLSSTAAGPTSSSIQLSEGDFSDSTAQLFYSVEVVGPDNIQVPVDVSVRLTSSANNPNVFILPDEPGVFASFSAESSFDINSGEISDSVGVDSGRNPTVDADNESFNQVFNATANQAINVAESTGVGLQFGGSGAATADPFFQIDPAFLEQNPGYSIVVSDGVGNSPLSAVPEPGAWAMMFAGLFGVGGMIRGVRRKIAIKSSPGVSERPSRGSC